MTTMTQVTTPAALVLDVGEQGQWVQIAPGLPAGASLMLRGPDGLARLVLHVDAHEVLIEPLGARVRVCGAGALSVDVPQLHVSARASMTLHSEGALCLTSAQRVEIRAPVLDLEATQGDVAVTANDDVRVEGERIRMNA